MLRHIEVLELGGVAKRHIVFLSSPSIQYVFFSGLGYVGYRSLHTQNIVYN